MLKNHRFALEAGGEDEIPAVSRHHRERTGRLHVHVLELVKLFGLRVPEVDLRERVVAAQGQVASVLDAEGLEDHGSSRGQSLHLRELPVAPLEDLGVADVAREGQVPVSLQAERLDRHHVVHVGDFAVKSKLLSAFVPHVDGGQLGATG